MMELNFASNQGEIGGGEVMMLAMADVARSLGCAVTVVAPAQPSAVLKQARQHGFDTVAVPGKTTRQYLRNLRGWDRKMRRGVLWCNGLRPATATSGHPNRVVHLHQLPTGAQLAASRLARQGALLTVVPSYYLQQHVSGARVLWNWTPDLQQPRRVPRGPLAVGYLGRLSAQKGVPMLCAALGQVRNHTAVRLVLAGEHRFSSDAEADEVQYALLRLGAGVEQLGWVSASEFFGQVDVAVVPSVAPESFGLVAAEAMSAGVPLIVTDAGALREVVGEPYRWIVPADDVDSLAIMIGAAAEADWDAQLAASRARWQEHFSPQAGRARMAALLTELSAVVG